MSQLTLSLAETTDSTATTLLWVGGVVAICIAAVVVVVIWQIAATKRATAAISREQAYRTLAEEAAQAQERTQQALERLAKKVDSIEQVLRQVE